MATYEDLANLLFPEITKTIDDLERQYPARNLPEGAQVTRFAPSPTGFLHTGSLFTAFIAYTVAKQSGGVYFFRLEDTDTKRTIAGSADELIDQLAHFGIVADEGYFPGKDKGSYGPYQQSKRAEIYKIVIKELVRQGQAYPDFMTADELAALRKFQEDNKILPGYYGPYARDRKLSVDEAIAKIKAGTPWVIRYKSMGDHNKKIKFTDRIRGTIELADNDVDIVILKSDGLPTYHFAHVVDDHFMRTTVVTRGEEWIPSTPIHLQLFRSLNWKAPKYAHLPVIMKLDHGNKRKLSKRKDPEAAVSFFLKTGYPPKALLVYLMSIANSNFEEWTLSNKSYEYSDFKFTFAKMSLDGALFDQSKLNFFAKETIATIPTGELVSEVTSWAKENDPVLNQKIEKDPIYFSKVLGIERERANPRKDYAKYSDIEPATRFFYDEDYQKLIANPLPFNPKYSKDFLKKFMGDVALKMSYGVDESTWWNSVKEVAAENGFAIANKDYKANPDAYQGSVSDAAEIIRICLTGSKDSPNLHEVIEILGKERVQTRLRNL